MEEKCFVEPEDLSLVKKISEALIAARLSIGTAESCTGGRIASMITSLPGSSQYFVGGVVSYSNEVKHNVLGVSKDDLKKYGAVSQTVVEQMAQGAIRVLGCDCSVATSGIAGPDGGTKQKPVGSVWIAVAFKDKVRSVCYQFDGDRCQVIQESANSALWMLLHLIEDEESNE